MIEVIDRQPLGNGKNNVLRLSIPANVTTVAALVSLLNSGVYGDVFSNNTTGSDKGASVVGTPINRKLFESIREMPVSLVDPLDIRIEKFTAPSSGWVTREFEIPFSAAPVCILSDPSTGYLTVQNVTAANFQYYARSTSTVITALYVDTGENMEVF